MNIFTCIWTLFSRLKNLINVCGKFCFFSSIIITLFSTHIYAENRSENNSEENVTLKKITLQLKWKHQFQFAGYYMAQEKGFYREKGLTVNIIEAQPGIDPVQRVINGEADFGIGTSSLLLYRERNAPVVVLGVVYQHSPLVFLMKQKEAKGRTLKDLIGKKVMVEPLSDELFAYLKREKIDPKSLELVTHQFDIRDLIDDKIQAISAYSTTEPFLLEEAGIDYVVFNPRAVGIDFYGDNLFTTELQIKNHPEQVAGFREASFKGWNYALNHPEETIQVILKKYSQRLNHDQLWFEYNQMMNLIQPDLVEIGYMNTRRWQHIADIYGSLGMFPEKGLVDEHFFYDYYVKSQKIDYVMVSSIGLGALILLSLLGYALTMTRKLSQQIVRREQAENILKTNEEKYRAIYEYAPLVLLVWDKDFNIIDSNRYAEQIFGWKKEEMERQSIMQIIPASDQLKVTQVLEKIIQQPDLQCQLGHSINYNITKDGRVLLFEWENTILKNDKGEVFAAMSLGIDITEKHKIQEALTKNKEKYRFLLEMVPFPIVIAYLQNGQVVYLNHQAEQHLKVVLSEANKPKNYLWQEMIPDEAIQKRIMQAVSTQSGISELELTLQTKEGDIFWAHFSARLTEFENAPAILIAFSDMSERKVFEQALQASQTLLENVLENMEQAMLVLDAEMSIVTYNKKFQQMFRFENHELYNGREGEKVIEAWLQKIDGSDLDISFSKVRSHFERNYRYSHEFYQIFKSDRETEIQEDHLIQWIELFHNPLPDGGSVRTYNDITSRKLAEEALKKSEAHFRVIVDAIPSPLFLVRVVDERIYYVNEPAGKILGINIHALIGKTIEPFCASPEKKIHIMEQLKIHQVVHNVEVQMRRLNGEHFWAIVTLSLTELNHEQIIVVGLIDISERRDMEEALRDANEHLSQQLDEIKKLQHQLQEQAIRDALTGLFNRRYLDEMLEVELLKAKREGYPLGLVLLDIDHFKKLNDTYGHQAGDVVLQRLGGLLKEQTGAKGFACRYGGEEFLIFFPKMGLTFIEKFAERLRVAFQDLVVHFGDFDLKNTLSLGIATYPGHGKTAVELIEQADQALYYAKRNGRNQVITAQMIPLLDLKN